MVLQAGMRLGAFEVQAPLGSGGMGDVWRARDSTLGRTVALKVLPDAFTEDRERLARFEHEARVLASLNHPHIASLYGLEQLGGRRVLVMELAEGEDLATRLTRGPLPRDEALPIARQIAEALEEAHEKGIVHRDLKPANVKVSAEGNVKVLDFGLAKAFRGDGADASHDQSRSPTKTRETEAGVILGTAPYMSPEQARGKAVDRRSDIWSFGVVLFEMLTGRKLFDGETASDTLAAVLTREPDWSLLPASTPAALERLLRLCLIRDPKHRLQSIGDARVELELASEPGREAQTSAELPGAGGSRGGPWLAAAWLLAGAAAGALATTLVAGKWEPPIAPLVRTEILLPAGVEVYAFSALAPSLAMPPDGSWVAFIGAGQGKRPVFVRHMAQGEARPLRGASLPYTICASHDGRSLGVIELNGALNVLPIVGGPATQVADSADFSSCQWDDRGIVFTRQGALWEAPAAGGPVRPLTRLRDNELLHGLPASLPGGRYILFTSLSRLESPRIDVVARDTGERRTLLERAARPLYTPSGHLLFFRADLTDLFVVPFDPVRAQLIGDPVPVPESIGMRRQLALSATGTLVHVRGGMGSRRLVLVTREGLEETILDAPRDYACPRFSPDGRSIVVEAAGGLWLFDVERRTLDRLFPSNPFMPSYFPTWSADGRRVFYRSPQSLRVVPADGSGRIEELWGQSCAPISAAPDGRSLVCQRISPEAGADLYIVSLGGPAEPRALLATPAFDGSGQISPDGRWLLHTSDESGRTEVFLRPFPALDRKWQVSTTGGTYPHWNPNGREIFFFAEDRMISVSVATQPSVALSPPRELFRGSWSRGNSTTIPHYDVSRDGRKFLFVKEDATTGSSLVVVQNWFQELGRLAPQRR
jgi:Tol biopolymer transport system component